MQVEQPTADNNMRCWHIATNNLRYASLLKTSHEAALNAHTSIERIC